MYLEFGDIQWLKRQNLCSSGAVKERWKWDVKVSCHCHKCFLRGNEAVDKSGGTCSLFHAIWTLFLGGWSISKGLLITEIKWRDVHFGKMTCCGCVHHGINVSVSSREASFTAVVVIIWVKDDWGLNWEMVVVGWWKEKRDRFQRCHGGRNHKIWCWSWKRRKKRLTPKPMNWTTCWIIILFFFFKERTTYFEEKP